MQGSWFSSATSCARRCFFTVTGRAAAISARRSASSASIAAVFA
jgi:hypothetical protein